MRRLVAALFAARLPRLGGLDLPGEAEINAAQGTIEAQLKAFQRR